MRALLIIALFACLPCQVVARVEPTPIPRDAKPDFSQMRPLIGAWHCLVASSRRPRPFASDATTFVSSDGYWLVTKTVTGKVPWNPVEIHNTEYVTYDPTTHRWIDLSMDDFGAYDVSESKGWTGKSIVWTEIAYPKLHGAAALAPRRLVVFGQNKTVLSTSFAEGSGQRVSVTTTCVRRE